MAQRRRPVTKYDFSRVPQAKLDELARLEAELAAAQSHRQQESSFVYQRRGEAYWNDPVAWAHDCIEWPEGKHLASYQEEVLVALHEKGRVAMRSMHGAGKSALSAIAVLHFAQTRDAAGADWKCPTTASVWRQLEDYLWPEIRKWARLLRWNVLGRDPFDMRTELLRLNLKLRTGAAFALASDDPASLEGAHSDELLYVLDESKSISDATFDAVEGAFSTAGTSEGTNAYALAVSTPGEPIGRFYDIHARKPGTEDWWVRHVRLEEAIAAGRVTQEWAEHRKALWGEDSAVYKNRVEGEFASASEDGVIPLAWVELANERWRAIYERDGQLVGRHVEPSRGSRAVLEPGEKLHTIGVDVARGGEDRTVLALRQGNTICELRRLAFSENTMVTASIVIGVQKAHGEPRAVVDVIGIGAGVYDRIREEGLPCSPFNSSEGTKRTDLTSEFGFTAKRSWGIWNLREMLDPNNGCDVALPPDDYLTGDLLAPKWRVMSGGRIQVESKDEIRKRIGRSTDSGDACFMAMSESGGSWADLYRSEEEIAERTDPDVPQPRQKPSRSGGWGNVYRPRDTDDKPTQKPAPNGKPAEAEAPQPANRARLCACGDPEAAHPDGGGCQGGDCDCSAFKPRG